MSGRRNEVAASDDTRCFSGKPAPRGPYEQLWCDFLPEAGNPKVPLRVPFSVPFSLPLSPLCSATNGEREPHGEQQNYVVVMV